MLNFRNLEMKIYHFKFIHFLINKCLQLQFHFNFSHSTTSSWYVNNSDPISLPHIHISSSSQIHILNHLQNSRDWKGCKHDERERKFQWGKFCQVQFTNHQIHFLSFPLVVSHTTQQLYQSFPSFAVAGRAMMTATTQSKRIFSLFVVAIANFFMVVKNHVKIKTEFIFLLTQKWNCVELKFTKFSLFIEALRQLKLSLPFTRG